MLAGDLMTPSRLRRRVTATRRRLLLAGPQEDDLQDADTKRSGQDANHEIYEYGNDSYTKVATNLRYTHGEDGIMAGGERHCPASVGQRRRDVG